MEEFIHWERKIEYMSTDMQTVRGSCGETEYFPIASVLSMKDKVISWKGEQVSGMMKFKERIRCKMNGERNIK